MFHVRQKSLLICDYVFVHYLLPEECRRVAGRGSGRHVPPATEAPVIREVVPTENEARDEARQRLDRLCRRLTRLDPELVEWTLPPAEGTGKRVAAELMITDGRRPLEQLTALLRRVADEVQRLSRS